MGTKGKTARILELYSRSSLANEVPLHVHNVPPFRREKVTLQADAGAALESSDAIRNAATVINYFFYCLPKSFSFNTLSAELFLV